VAKQYRSWTPRQSFLLPPSPLEWLRESHLAYFVLDVVDEVDLSSIEISIQSKDPRGERPYSPRMMIALLLYAYCTGVYSSRRIGSATYEDIPFRVLAGGSHPHFTTINQFRLDHLEALKALFLEVLKLCQRAGLVRLGHVALDGSKVQANASKHKAMTYERMSEDEKRLSLEIEELLERARRVDQEEDEPSAGAEQREEDIPAELARRESRLARIREAKAALEQDAAKARAEKLRKQAEEQQSKANDPAVNPVEKKRARTRAEKAEVQADKLDPSQPQADTLGEKAWPHHRVPANVDGTPKPNAQRNFTDADSRIMLKDGAYLQAYNAQIIVDDHAQVIVAEGVSNQAPDQEHLVPMVRSAVENCGDAPKKMTADNGYLSVANIEFCDKSQIDAHIAVGREQDRDAPPPSQTAETTPAQLARNQMRNKLQMPDGKAIYARRKSTVEPVLGQIKGARRFRMFSLRSFRKVRGEWTLVCLTHNLLKLYRSKLATLAA